MTNYGIEITDPNVDIQDALPEELVFNSEYKSFRVSSRGSGSISSETNSGLVTIPHNLKHTPIFLVHVDPDQLGKYYIAPYVPTGIFGTPLIYAYADSTNLYIQADATSETMQFYSGSNPNNYAFEYNSIYSTGGMYAGAASAGSENGAFRFTNITLTNSQSNILSAKLKFYVNVRSGSSLVKLKIRGIDEDNTGPFDAGTAAFGRSRTTAELLSNTNFSAGSHSDEDVKSIVEEIIGRAGWSSGNAIAFTLDDNGTTATNDYNDDYTTEQTYLEVVTRTATVANYKYTIFLNKLE